MHSNPSTLHRLHHESQQPHLQGCNRLARYKDQRELDALPAEIELLETRHAELLEIIAQPDFYEQPPDKVATTLTAVSESEQALDRALERLIELEG